ncbi:P-type conjugative transfer protein VirB9 (plasmid) [Methylobacterium radiotolerans]
MRRLAALVLLALGGTPAVHGEETPRPGRADTRIRTVVYSKDNVVGLDATFGTSLLVVLEPDEKIQTLALGDSQSWRVEPNKAGNMIFLKPVERDATSNLNVVTDRRIYTFSLRSNQSPPNRQIYKVVFRYPDADADARLLAQAREMARYPNTRQLDVANMNSAYGYKGSSANKPVAVYDDGKKTFFRFEGEVPALYIVDAERNESLVNFRTEGPYVVVDKVSLQWTLRNGAESTCVFNQRLLNLHEPTGLEATRPRPVGAS